MRRVENEPAYVHLRRGRSEWCVLSLCTGQGPWGCFNILLNVVFLLTLCWGDFQPREAPSCQATGKVSGLFQEKGHSPFCVGCSR